MKSFYDELFKAHPDPMWMFDQETLAFLDVNDAATAEYGYSRQEFLGMTVADIRPPEDVAALKASRKTCDGGPSAPETWRHLTKSGAIRVVEIRTRPIIYNGREARLVTARNTSELAAARAEADRLAQRLQTRLNNISDGFYTLDRQWKVSFINRRACEWTGRAAEQFIGKNLFDVYPVMRGTIFETEFNRAQTENAMVTFTDFDVFQKWYEVKAYSTTEGLAVFFRDISHERRTESQVQLLEAAAAQINDIVLITEASPISEPGPRIVYVNEAFVRISGYSREEAIGRSPRFLHGPQTQRDELIRVATAMERQEPVRTELIHYTKSGEEYWVEAELVPIAGASGAATHYVSVLRTTSERKRAERALALSEQRFRIVSQTTSDVIWDWDIVTDQVWWNDGLKTTFGYDPSTLPSNSPHATGAIQPKDRERVLRAIESLTNGGEESWVEEYEFVCADGSIAQVVERGFVIRDADGKATRAVGSLVDISEQRRLEAALRQAHRLEAVGQLTGGIAHDFNNLLTVILGNSEMLAEYLTGNDLMFSLADMTRTAAERGAELTNRLLAFSRKQALDPKAVDVNDLIKGMDSLLRRALGGQIEIAMEFGRNLPRALIDAAQLESALLNLCINARDAMPGGGTLTIEADNAWLDESYAASNTDVTPGRYVLVAVSDTGEGMSDDTIAHAFEPFFTTKGVGKGSGLGLSMVYGFIQQSKGHVKIYSEIGVGTTIRLYLPLAQEDALRDGPSGKTNIEPVGAERILVVEDDELVRTHVAATLRSLGYSVIVARHGHEALDMLAKPDRYDLLFTDVVMPGPIDGRQLADAVKLMRPTLPVLFTSGYTENAIVHNGRLDPGVQLLQKPYRRQDLAAKVRLAIDEANSVHGEGA